MSFRLVLKSVSSNDLERRITTSRWLLSIRLGYRRAIIISEILWQCSDGNN